MQHVFIIGSKGIPGNYGGYETFVDKLTEYHQHNKNIKYHVACKNSGSKSTEYHNARCFCVKVPDIGAAQAIYYDVAALKMCCRYIQENQIEHPVVYILACRIGPFAKYFQRKIHRLGGKVYVNPDGHEWMRAKWSTPVRWYWKISERMMIKYSDLLICDSRNIEKYIQDIYEKYHPNTTFIAYGSDLSPSNLEDDDKKFQGWLKEHGLKENEYYLAVGRFVPENNYETMIQEFIKSGTKKNLVLITNVERNKFFEKLRKKTGFEKDRRIRFVGTVYMPELLKKIRKNAYGYLHGHEVGGTNPSLLEAMAYTKLNLLLDVGFNREVAEDAALYWSKEDGDLAGLIDKIDFAEKDFIIGYSRSAKQRIKKKYSWEYVTGLYEKIFCDGGGACQS